MSRMPHIALIGDPPMDRIEQILTPARRRWLYRIAWALLGLAGVYGLLTHEQTAAWLLVGAAVLGIADGHTDPTTTSGMPRRAIPPDDAP